MPWSEKLNPHPCSCLWAKGQGTPPLVGESTAPRVIRRDGRLRTNRARRGRVNHWLQPSGGMDVDVINSMPVRDEYVVNSKYRLK